MVAAMNITITPRIREAREARGLTQAMLGAIVGCYPSTIKRLEDGSMVLTVAWAVRLAVALEAGIEELFDWSVN